MADKSSVPKLSKHRYARGIPRVTNVLSEHALISSFVDQRKPVPQEVVEEVARDFELHEIDPWRRRRHRDGPMDVSATPQASPAALAAANGKHPPLVESLLQALNTLVERLNNAEITVEPERERQTEKALKSPEKLDSRS